MSIRLWREPSLTLVRAKNGNLLVDIRVWTIGRDVFSSELEEYILDHYISRWNETDNVMAMAIKRSYQPSSEVAYWSVVVHVGPGRV